MSSRSNTDGLFLAGAGGKFNVDQTQAAASGVASHGLASSEVNGNFNADRSELTGATGSVNASTSTVHIGASRLGGAVTAGGAKRAATHNGTTCALLSTRCA